MILAEMLLAGANPLWVIIGVFLFCLLMSFDD